jgi:hypothetical protein
VVQFAVALKDAEWTIFRDGEVLVRGMSRSRAVEEAESLAQEAVQAGVAVELLIQDYLGEVVTRRTLL